MAEFCPDCLDKINRENGGAQKYILSRYPERCEECGEMKRVVVVECKYFFFAYCERYFSRYGCFGM